MMTAEYYEFIDICNIRRCQCATCRNKLYNDYGNVDNFEILLSC